MRLAILGASGHGKVVADTAECCGWDQVCFFDDAWPEKTLNGTWSIEGGTTELLAGYTAFDGVIVAIGNNEVRRAKTRQLMEVGAPVVSLIHPGAYVSRYAVVSPGSVVFAGAVINAGTSVGKAAIINTGATVDHDCHLGTAVHISPGAHLAGGVEIGDCSWIGIGAAVKQTVSIGHHVIVGAGAAVVSDFGDNQVAVGVPAKRMEAPLV